MAPLAATNFIHGPERSDPTIPAGERYTIFEPIVEGPPIDGEASLLNSDQVLLKMRELVADLARDCPGFEPGSMISVGIFESLKQVLETDEKELATGFGDHRFSAPEVPGGILKTIARVAQASGFNPETAQFSSTLGLNQLDFTEEDLIIHADGLLGRVTPRTERLKLARFVYATSSGTLIYPRIYAPGTPVNSYRFPYRKPTNIDLINTPRLIWPSDEEMATADAQQVMPGKILGFDLTRRLFHQAPRPDEQRAILVTEVSEVVNK